MAASHLIVRQVGSSLPLILAGLIIFPPETAQAANCPDRVRETARAGSSLELLLEDGTHLEGAFVYVSPNSDTLGLRTFDPRLDQYTDHDVPFDTISRVSGESERFSLTYPILGGVVLGALGLVVGLGYTSDPDGNDDDSLAWEAPLAGAAVGFGLGAIVSLLLPNTIAWDADCR